MTFLLCVSHFLLALLCVRCCTPALLPLVYRTRTRHAAAAPAPRTLRLRSKRPRGMTCRRGIVSASLQAPPLQSSLMFSLALLLALALALLPALPRASTPPYAPRAPRANAWRRRRTKTAAGLQAPRTNNDARRRKDAACPHGHKAGDADRWGKRELGRRPGNGAPLRARVSAFHLPCERGLNSHTVVDTRPRLSLAL